MHDIVVMAENVARAVHANQGYGGESFIEAHLVPVVELVKANGGDPDQIAAAWLHDALEDTALAHRTVYHLIGQRAADIVYACTGIGRNRFEAQQAIMSKLQNRPYAAIVKVADRIANVEACKRKGDTDKFQMYVGEWPEFNYCIKALALVPSSMMARLEKAHETA